jgi:hypothetical protein
MTQTVQVPLAGGSLPFTVDFAEWTWTSVAQLDEGDFPLAFEDGGKRYEIYSDGTFAAVELP